MPRKIGISCLAYGILPLLKGPEHVLYHALEDSMDGLQLLPIWWWSQNHIANIPPERVISYEHAWNNGSLWQSLTNTKRLKADRFMSPLYDIALFMGLCNIPQQKVDYYRQTFPRAIEIDTGTENSLHEINFNNQESWRAAARICFDTHHAIEAMHGDTEAAQMVCRGLSENILAIHVHIDAREYDGRKMLRDLMRNTGYIYNVIKKCHPEAPIIIEIMQGDAERWGYSLKEIALHLRSL